RGDVADERAELAEGARVEQRGDACPRVELARRAVALEPLVAAHRARERAALGEVVEGRAPVVGRVAGHGSGGEAQAGPGRGKRARLVVRRVPADRREQLTRLTGLTGLAQRRERGPGGPDGRGP